jgi:hypothetical protein
VSNNIPLVTIATQSFLYITLSVKDVVNLSRISDSNFLFKNMPDNIANKVLSFSASVGIDGHDTIWREGTNTYQFSVQIA